MARSRVRLGAKPWITSGACALLAIALLIGGQVWFPSGNAMKSSPPGNVSAIHSLALAPRELILANGRVRLNAASYPAIGGLSAELVVAVLFDYTCETCRANHPALLEALHRHGSQLTIILIPTPLDPACNIAIARLMPEHADACDYARYALAVWRAQPEKFAAYDAWLMAGGGARPPPLARARQYAEALVGVAPFTKALADAGLMHSLRDSGEIYRTLESGIIPKLLLPDQVLEGGFTSQAQLDLALKLGKNDE
jgi:hypothetical protein